MIKKFKVKYNIILGILLGFILAQFVIAEGYAILVGLQQMAGETSISLDSNVIIKIQWLSLAVFIGTICIFCTKKFRNINFNKISVYITLVLILSIVITFEILFIIIVLVDRYFPVIIYYVTTNYFVSVNITFIVILLGTSIFFTTFILLLNRKVKYIKFLTKEIKSINEEGFGKTIEVKGEDELSELCNSINSMSIELAKKIDNEKKIEIAKSELITNISHDLKTPLTSIVGYLEILHKGQYDSETKQKYINIAYNKSLRLKDLVNELFEYTKITSHDFKINREKFNLSNLINQMVGESVLGFSSKNIKVILDNPYKELYTYLDIRLFSRAIENILKNAEKYSDENSEFTVKIKDIEGSIILSFTNKCDKLNEESLDKIFEKFYRIDESRTLQNEGSGLGLSIAKRIVELHGGTITAKKIRDNIQFIIKLNS